MSEVRPRKRRRGEIGLPSPDTTLETILHALEEDKEVVTTSLTFSALTHCPSCSPLARNIVLKQET